jgi:hypothetical protein
METSDDGRPKTIMNSPIWGLVMRLLEEVQAADKRWLKSLVADKFSQE